MKKYLVALTVGGIMEMPNISYSELELIEATDEKEACKIYDEKHNCSYFCGSCIGMYNEKTDMMELKKEFFENEFNFNIDEEVKKYIKKF